MQVDNSDSTSKFEDPEKCAEINVIYVYPDQTDLDGNDQKPRSDDGNSESVITSEEPTVSTENLYPSGNNHRNVGCNNDVYECSDEVEISKL